MINFREPISRSGAAASGHPRDLIVTHGGGGNWASKVVFLLILAFMVLAALGVFGH